jgi:hypothetical protein
MHFLLVRLLPTLLKIAAKKDTVAKEGSLQLRAKLGLGHIVGERTAFVALIKQIPPIAKYDVCLLIRDRHRQGSVRSRNSLLRRPGGQTIRSD